MEKKRPTGEVSGPMMMAETATEIEAAKNGARAKSGIMAGEWGALFAQSAINMRNCRMTRVAKAALA